MVSSDAVPGVTVRRPGVGLSGFGFVRRRLGSPLTRGVTCSLLTASGRSTTVSVTVPVAPCGRGPPRTWARSLRSSGSNSSTRSNQAATENHHQPDHPAHYTLAQRGRQVGRESRPTATGRRRTQHHHQPVRRQSSCRRCAASAGCPSGRSGAAARVRRRLHRPCRTSRWRRRYPGTSRSGSMEAGHQQQRDPDGHHDRVDQDGGAAVLHRVEHPHLDQRHRQRNQPDRETRRRSPRPAGRSRCSTRP